MKSISLIVQLRIALLSIVLLSVSAMLYTCWLSLQVQDDALAMNKKMRSSVNFNNKSI